MMLADTLCIFEGNIIKQVMKKMDSIIYEKVQFIPSLLQHCRNKKYFNDLVTSVLEMLRLNCFSFPSFF